MLCDALCLLCSVTHCACYAMWLNVPNVFNKVVCDVAFVALCDLSEPVSNITHREVTVQVVQSGTACLV